jgi:hypothetical protein
MPPSARLGFKALLIVLGLSASLHPQQSSDNDPALILRSDAQRRAKWANQWLSSADPVRVAWGAWLARADHIRSLTPMLVQQVDSYQAHDEYSAALPEDDRHDALLVVLDALITLDAIVPADEAHKLYPEFPAQSLILLLRSRNNTSALLDIFQKAKANWNWLAAGNALAEIHYPGFVTGFAFTLLNRFTEHLAISVVSPQAGAGGGTGGGGSECGFSMTVPKQNWPPAGLYQLTQFPERLPKVRATLLVSGETPVYYLRMEPGNYYNPPDATGYCDDGNRDRYRSQYLNEMLKPAEANWNAYPYEIIEWRNEASYRGKLQDLVDRQRAKFFGLVAALRQSGALTSNEAANLALRLEMLIRDDRAHHSSPLPELSEQELTVPVKSAFTPPLD